MRNIFVSVLFFFVATTAAQAAGCYEATIQQPQPFLGNGGEVVILSDGSIWNNMSHLYLYLYAYYPTVVICPDEGRMILNDNAFDVVKVR
jgi:hypothetical protein